MQVKITVMLARLKVPVSWRELLKRAGKEFIADNALDLGAQQAYYFFFALFPALLTLISIASFFPIANLVPEVVRALGQVLPGDVLQLLAEQILAISNSGQGGVLTFAFLLTIWSSSGAILSIITTLNAAYDVTEARPWWKVRLVAIGLTIGMAFFILTSLSLVLVGPTFAEHIADAMRLGPVFKWTWWILQWPVVLILVASGIGLIYYFAPDAKQDWVWLTPGSIVATLLWILVSLLFKLYLSFFGNYNETYGAIGTVIVLLTWLYLAGLAIIFGAELNAEIEHASPHGKNIGEKVAGEKQGIGAAARQDFNDRQARGEMPVVPFPDDVNCDLDDPSQVYPQAVRASEMALAAIALLPVAIKVGRDVRTAVREREQTRSALPTLEIRPERH